MGNDVVDCEMQLKALKVFFYEYTDFRIRYSSSVSVWVPRYSAYELPKEIRYGIFLILILAEDHATFRRMIEQYRNELEYAENGVELYLMACRKAAGDFFQNYLLLNGLFEMDLSLFEETDRDFQFFKEHPFAVARSVYGVTPEEFLEIPNKNQLNELWNRCIEKGKDRMRPFRCLYLDILREKAGSSVLLPGDESVFEGFQKFIEEPIVKSFIKSGLDLDDGMAEKLKTALRQEDRREDGYKKCRRI